MATPKDIAEPGPLMAGKRGLVMGVANDRSIAWGIARVLHGQGAELAFSYQGGAFGRRAVPLAESIGAKIIEEVDVEDLDSVERMLDVVRDKWGSLDFVVHALAFSDRNELKGRYCDTTRKNFEHTMVISCFSFTEICQARGRHLCPMAVRSMIALTYGGATRVGAVLQCHGRRQGGVGGKRSGISRSDLGVDGIRVNALSAGADADVGRRSGVSDARYPIQLSARSIRLLRRTPTLDEVGGCSTLSSVADLSGGRDR